MAAVTPYALLCMKSVSRHILLPAVILIAAIAAFFFYDKKNINKKEAYAITAFMALTAFLLLLSGDKPTAFIWFLFIIPYDSSLKSNKPDTALITAATVSLFILGTLSSSMINGSFSINMAEILAYIIQPLLLFTGLQAIKFADDDPRADKSSYVLPFPYLSPLLPDPNKNTDSQLFGFLNSLEEGIFIANREGTIINASSQFASFFDTRPEELAGFSIFDKYALPVTHQNKAYSLIKKNMDGLPSGPDEFYFELKNGKKTRLLIMTMPIIIESIPSVIGIAKPLHRNKGTFPHQQAGPKDKFQTLSENSTDIIIRFDRQLRHIYANYAITGLTGMAVENFLGKTCQETKYPKQILEILEEKVLKVFETGEPIETEFYNDWGTGEVYFDLRLIPEKGSSGRVETVLSTARDITPLKKAHMTIQTLTQEIIKAQELERNRIALDLHDNVAQTLASLKIACDTILDQEPGISDQTIMRFKNFSVLLKGGIDSVRELAYNLRPPGIDQLGIIKTLSQLCSEFTAAYKIKADFQSWGIEGLKLSSDTQINLYRLLQEALSNVKKHSGAKNINVKLVSSHPNIILRVEDDGKGFNVDTRSQEAINEKRMGLQGMHERARMLGGRMKIISRRGEGTKVIIEVPISAAEDKDLSNCFTISESISL
ncbi:PAS domain-containing sensor histidine kinase [Desulforegula conservatrix]|uniref:PAS domain-containing sensor histidine kinase n=1 Tax=Desulforegula conservatrix TaxID=153026 RepID=UPI0018DB1390|nr:PAS domain-containing protein [Desulforegula conservatrix]